MGNLFGLCQYSRGHNAARITEHKHNPKESRFEITGVSDLDKIQTDFFNILNNRQKVSRNILFDSDFRPIEVDGKTVIYISVPEADYHVKPIYINDNLVDGSFKRSHEGDRRLSREELAMFRMIGYGDNIGSGFQKILSAWKTLGYTCPDLKELDDVREVWLTLPIELALTQQEASNLEQANGYLEQAKEQENTILEQVKEQENLSELQKEVLLFLISNPTTSLKSCSNATGGFCCGNSLYLKESEALVGN